MVRSGDWKYIFMANGGREQLFNLRNDPNELTNLAEIRSETKRQMHGKAVAACLRPELRPQPWMADDFRSFSFQARPLRRIYQFRSVEGREGFSREAGGRSESVALLIGRLRRFSSCRAIKELAHAFVAAVSDRRRDPEIDATIQVALCNNLVGGERQ